MTSPSPPPVRKLTPNASPYMRYLIWMRRLALSLAVLLALWTPHGAQAQGPDPRINTINMPSELEYPGQPFDVEVWASNAGTDAEGGGSITISLPEGHDLSILDASVQILPEDWSDCAYTAPHAWVVKPDSPCNRALQHNTSCKGQIDVRYPLAARSANTASVIVVGTVNARRHPGQSRLVNALLDRPLVVVALDAPYDLMGFPDVATYLATYSDVPVSLDALAQVLFGLARPGGHLPVDLPGLYPLGHGITDFVRK